MKKMMYILVMFCGLLIFSKNVKAEGYKCAYLMKGLDDQNYYEVLSYSVSGDKISFENKINGGAVSSILDFVVDDRYSNYIEKRDLLGSDGVRYKITDSSQVNKILINDVLNGKCSRQIYLCKTSGKLLQDKTYGVLFKSQYVSTVENFDYAETDFEGIEGLSKDTFIFPATDCQALDIDQSNSTGEIIDSYSTECEYYMNHIEKDEEGKIVGGDLYEKYQSQSLTEYEEEKEKLRSFCNSALKTGDYKIDPCVESCLEFTTDIQDIENINISSGECGLSDRIINWIKNIIKWVKYIAPVLVIILGIMDFIKAIASSNEDAMKKAQARFIKRIIVAALVFIVPFLIEFVLNSFNLGADNPYCKVLGE